MTTVLSKSYVLVILINIILTNKGCQSDAVRNWHQRLSPLRWWVRYLVKISPHVIERATLSDSVGFPRGSGFLLHRPVLSIELIIVDAHLSIQYLKNTSCLWIRFCRRAESIGIGLEMNQFVTKGNWEWMCINRFCVFIGPQTIKYLTGIESEDLVPLDSPLL
jgi:hypothetical protein